MVQEDATALEPSLVDRDLVNRDLDRLADLLAPLLLASLEVIPELGKQSGIPGAHTVLRKLLDPSRLRGYLRPMISSATEGLRTLPDGELYGLCAVLAVELGAWCRQREPLTSEELRSAAPALAHLLGTAPDHLEQAVSGWHDEEEPGLW